MTRISSSELILNPDGSVYHLKLKPGQVSNDIITVGDQNRVDQIARHLESIELTVQNREFKTITGSYKGKRLTVISTGIGTDNIDIVLNEIDALFNIDIEHRVVKEELAKLNFYRIGTSGAIREDIALDSFIISRYAVGLDILLRYYDSANVRALAIEKSLKEVLPNMQYAVASDDSLMDDCASIGQTGITLTAPGFYAPQNRHIRLRPKQDLFKTITDYSYQGHRITNLEMETAGIYGLSKLLGHKAVSFNAILANRVTGEFSSQPTKTVDRLIERVLNRIVSDS